LDPDLEEMNQQVHRWKKWEVQASDAKLDDKNINKGEWYLWGSSPFSEPSCVDGSAMVAK